MTLIERTLKLGEMMLASILCDLEKELVVRMGKDKAEELVNRVEGEILGEPAKVNVVIGVCAGVLEDVFVFRSPIDADRKQQELEQEYDIKDIDPAEAEDNVSQQEIEVQ